MSSGTTNSERLTEALDSAVAEDAQQGRLDDAEIQRLVVLSRDASYQRTERVPVKTVEAFEPRSLVSIAMDAQRRREAEMRTAAAAGATINADADAAADSEAVAGEAEPEAVAASSDDGNADISATGAGEQGVDDDAAQDAAKDSAKDSDKDAAKDAAKDADGDGEAASTQGTSQIDFEAGRVAGIEEGRTVGLAEGHAKGLEEGRAAGRAEASAQLERAIQAFEAAAGKLGDMTDIDSSALGESIHAAILTLASERAGRAIAEQPDAFANRIEGLLAAIRTASGQPVIHLNPGDLGSIQPLVETREKLRHCSFVAAPDLAAGDLTVTVGTIGIDDMLLPTSSAMAGDAPAPATSDDMQPDNADAPADATIEHPAGDVAADDAVVAETGSETETDADAQTDSSDD